VTSWWDPQVDQWVWQRRATAELAAILAGHPDLPALSWTVGAAGCALTGRIRPQAGAQGTRRMFAQWQEALGLSEPAGRPGVVTSDPSGVRHLRSRGRRGGVRILLAGDIEPPEDEAGPETSPDEQSAAGDGVDL
jgi:hypothetical protein